MAIAIIAGLEVLGVGSDWRVRSICNSAIAQIVFSNQQKFVHEDRLLTVWNLFFSLSSIASISPVFPDRIVIVKALCLLAPLYSREDQELTENIVSTLLKLSNKVSRCADTSRR
jgi:hypothetical protein